MSGSNLQTLERDVELARDRLAHDLARLRSPETISEFKDTLWAEARETKDELIEKTKDAAQDGIQRIIADLKERAAANPAAVLAIGAGLAWRLIHRPPMASLLVGIGLVSLFRANRWRDGCRRFQAAPFRERHRAGMGRRLAAGVKRQNE